MRINVFILMIGALTLSCKQEMIKADKYKFLIGTYTQKEGHVDGKGDGIYVVEFDMVNKSMKVLDTIKDLTNPSFLVATNEGKRVYAVNEISPNEKLWPGKISLFELDNNGQYRKAQEAGTYGNAPCHISVNTSKTAFAISNYLGSNLCYGFLDKDGKIDGALKYITVQGKGKHERQDSPHLHQSIFTKDGNTLLVTDLGSDSIRVYNLDKTNQLFNTVFSIALDSADGPRHMVLSPNEEYLYVLNELSNTISAFQLNLKDGNASLQSKVNMLPSDFKSVNHGGDIHMSKNGQFLYASNRGHNSIACYKVDGGKMELKSHTKTGDIPRNFTFTKDGAYLFCANQNSDDIYIYEVETNGDIQFIQKFSISTPVCLEEI